MGTQIARALVAGAAGRGDPDIEQQVRRRVPAEVGPGVDRLAVGAEEHVEHSRWRHRAGFADDVDRVAVLTDGRLDTQHLGVPEDAVMQEAGVATVE